MLPELPDPVSSDSALTNFGVLVPNSRHHRSGHFIVSLREVHHERRHIKRERLPRWGQCLFAVRGTSYRMCVNSVLIYYEPVSAHTNFKLVLVSHYRRLLQNLELFNALASSRILPISFDEIAKFLNISNRPFQALSSISPKSAQTQSPIQLTVKDHCRGVGSECVSPSAEAAYLVPEPAAGDLQGNGVPVELAAELTDLDGSQLVCKWLDPAALEV